MTELTLPPIPEIQQFAPGVLEKIREQFPDKAVCLTTVPGGETLASQKADNVIGFQKTALWVFDQEAQEKLRAKPTLPTEVVYFSTGFDKTYVGAFDRKEVAEVNRYYPAEPRIIESRKEDTVQAIVEGLPKVAGIRWEVTSAAMLARILVNHSKENNGTSLLPDHGVWTSDEYDAPQRTHMKLPTSHLILGWFDGNSVSVGHLVSGEQRGTARVFVVGLPETTSNPQNLT